MVPTSTFRGSWLKIFLKQKQILSEKLFYCKDLGKNCAEQLINACEYYPQKVHFMVLQMVAALSLVVPC